MQKENKRLIRGGNRSLKFKTVSDKELSEIKEKIRKSARKEQILPIIFVLLILLTVIALIMPIALSSYKREKEFRIHMNKVNEREKLNSQLYYLNSGYKYLEKEEYHNAKFQFNKAALLYAESYKTRVAMATAYLYDCMKNKVDCEKAENLLKNLNTDFGDKTEVKELNEYLIK